MPTTNQSNQWRGAQFAARGASSATSAPGRYAVYRETVRPDVSPEARYLIHQETECLAPDQFKAWQVGNGFMDGRELDLALLVIRETLGADGTLEQCVIERRRGSVDGPFRGNPARIELQGVTNPPTLFSVRNDGTLYVTTPSMPARGPSRRRGRRPAQGFLGEDEALRAHFRADIAVVQRRAPNLAEELMGISAVVHVRVASHARQPRVIGCGIGWFGPMPFVLTGNFPRLGQVSEFPIDVERMIGQALRERGLVGHETRMDQLGPCLMACDRDRRNLFVARPDQDQIRIDPYVPIRQAIGTDDQQRWLRYVEAHEGLVALDTYLIGQDGMLVVLTGDDQGQVWHHDIDPDGVEIGWGPANETAVAFLHRERLARDPR